MKVCMIVYNYWPFPVGGMEKQCRRLVNALHEGKMASVTIVTARFSLANPVHQLDNGTTIYRCAIFQPVVDVLLRFKNRWRPTNVSRCDGEVESSDSQGFTASFAAKVVYWLNVFVFLFSAGFVCFKQRKTFDVIHVQSTEWINGFAVILGKILKKPIVSKEASYPPFREFEFRVPFNALLNRFRFRGNYFALTASVASEIKVLANDGCKVFVVPNGVDVPADTASLEAGNTVLWVGNVTRGIFGKGLDVLIQSWAVVKKKSPASRLILVGGGTLDLVREFAKEHGVEDCIEFAGYTTDIGKFYKQADTVVSASRREGMSNVLLEAQAWGIPVIVSDIPGNNGIVVDGVNGILFPSENPELLAEAILLILADKDMRKRMGKAGRELMQKEYSIERTCERVLESYKQIVN